MHHKSHWLVKIGLSLGLACAALSAHALTPKIIKQETPQYIIAIKYPQGFQKAEINSAVQNYINEVQKKFMKELAEDANTQADAPGKTGLNISYSIPYQSHKALSVRFDISTYHRGAAHPANSVVIQNFVKGQQVSMANLFIKENNYLLAIADFCNKEITAKKISDTEWIKKGTQANNENYDIWYFTKDGLAVVFDTYQVAAYVYGPQTVSIPKTVFAADLKPEMSKAIWGN